MGRRVRDDGFTLVECLIASIIVAVAAVSASMAFSSGHRQSAYAVHARRAARPASEMMEYILSLPYYDPQGASNVGPDSGEAQFSDYDNADDLNGYVEFPGELKRVAGGAYPSEYQGFSRSVSATYGAESLDATSGAIPGLTVTVTVSDQAGQTWHLTAFIASPAN